MEDVEGVDMVDMQNLTSDTTGSETNVRRQGRPAINPPTLNVGGKTTPVKTEKTPTTPMSDVGPEKPGFAMGRGERKLRSSRRISDGSVTTPGMEEPEVSILIRRPRRQQTVESGSVTTLPEKPQRDSSGSKADTAETDNVIPRSVSLGAGNSIKQPLLPKGESQKQSTENVAHSPKL